MADQTADEQRKARQNPEPVGPAVPYNDQTKDQRAKISGKGWALMIRKRKITLGIS